MGVRDALQCPVHQRPDLFYANDIWGQPSPEKKHAFDERSSAPIVNESWPLARLVCTTEEINWPVISGSASAVVFDTWSAPPATLRKFRRVAFRTEVTRLWACVLPTEVSAACPELPSMRLFASGHANSSHRRQSERKAARRPNSKQRSIPLWRKRS